MKWAALRNRFVRGGDGRTPLNWPIASHLLALLLVALLVTFSLVSLALLAYRLPAIEREDHTLVQRDIEDVSRRLESLLGTAESRMGLVETLLDGASPDEAQRLLAENLLSSLAFGALYSVSPEGRVVAAAVDHDHSGRLAALLGTDLSGNALVQALSGKVGAAWNGRYLSPVTGQRTIGVGLRNRQGQMLIAEMAFDAYFKYVLVAAGKGVASFWIVDRRGEVIVDSEAGRARGRLHLGDWPLLQEAMRQPVAVQEVAFQGKKVLAAATYSPSLDWYFVARKPTGLDHPALRDLLASVAVSFGGCLLTGLVIATFWARRLARPLQDIEARARATARGHPVTQAWSPGPVAEFNALAQALETMADALREREQRFLGIFNAAPIPMGVADISDGLRIVDVNETWCRDLRRRREDVLGRTAIEIGLWPREERERILAERQGDKIGGEAHILRGDGEAVPVQVFGQHVRLPTQDRLVWATVDIGPLRARKSALRELNHALEARIAQRTQALAEANAALGRQVDQLRTAQDELVRSGTMAALGALVAGVAHEINTPLGNGVMAISALAEVQNRFEAAMLGGLKRADLDAFLAGLLEGSDIALRNLRRAAELVQSFKQVAVDQTSAKRRSFELHEIAQEMVASMRPSYARTPYQIALQVPMSGLAMDSYPGALGQVIGNLVQNAIVHGFDGRDHGTVRIEAQRDTQGWIVLRVTDDGRGIAAADLERIFDPFMTTRMGRGGTGLGLHISHNAVVNLLGGTLTVHSVEGAGTCFEVRLPTQAPAGPAPDAAAAGAEIPMKDHA